MSILRQIGFKGVSMLGERRGVTMLGAWTRGAIAFVNPSRPVGRIARVGRWALVVGVVFIVVWLLIFAYEEVFIARTTIS